MNWRKAGLITAVLLAAAAPAAYASSTPGSSPSNPITDPGEQTRPVTNIVIWWPDGQSETVPSDVTPRTRADALRLAKDTVVARAVAEGRQPVSTPANKTVRQTSSRFATKRRAASLEYGATACTATLWYPWKPYAGTVATDTYITCTEDVINIVDSLGLYRSQYWYWIGGAYGDVSRNWDYQYASGNCASSPWQYWSDLAWAVTSSVNGTLYGPYLTAGPSWISC